MKCSCVSIYDLQRVFDSIEYRVLLERLYGVGINGKCWRLLKNWYERASCQVKVEEGISEPFRIGRGVKQGSVLSSAIFLLIMDPLLKQLEKSGIGSVNNFYAGFIHADDIRTLASNIDSLTSQVSIKDFASTNFFQLNIQKCEIVVFSNSNSSSELPCCEIEGSVLPVGTFAKCLGYWWNRDLIATKSVEENIKRARKSLFHYGSIDAFHGYLNPLSTKSIIETCVCQSCYMAAKTGLLLRDV